VTDWRSDKKGPHQKRRYLRQTEAEPRYPQSYSATSTSILWPREQNRTRSLSNDGIGRVCTRPARTRATKEKMARCSQERLCWHGPDCTRRDSSCPRQRRLETIHSQATVACPCRSIAKALSQVRSESACLSSSVQPGSQVASISSYQAPKPSLSPVGLSPGAAVSPAALSLTDVNTQHSLQLHYVTSQLFRVLIYKYIRKNLGKS